LTHRHLPIPGELAADLVELFNADKLYAQRDAHARTLEYNKLLTFCGPSSTITPLRKTIHNAIVIQ
jgi:hypothetical protein